MGRRERERDPLQRRDLRSAARLVSASSSSDVLRSKGRVRWHRPLYPGPAGPQWREVRTRARRLRDRRVARWQTCSGGANIFCGPNRKGTAGRARREGEGERERGKLGLGTTQHCLIRVGSDCKYPDRRKIMGDEVNANNATRQCNWQRARRG